MPAHIRDEKQKVVHFIQQVPYPDEDKKGWLEQIEQEDLTEVLFEELHAGLKALPAEKFASDWARAKFSTDLTALTRNWRMHTASREFKHGR